MNIFRAAPVARPYHHLVVDILKKLLLVNSCVNRDHSRTDRLAHAVTAFFENYEIEELLLEDMNLRPMDSETLKNREHLLKAGFMDDPMFDLAHKFSSADMIVVASPYWENMFNSMLHIFIEHVAVVGLTFRYSENGVPVGLCRADRLFYVTTRGGPISDNEDLGYKIYSSLAQLYGIGQCIPVSAQALDIVGNDPDKIMTSVISHLPDIIGH